MPFTLPIGCIPPFWGWTAYTPVIPKLYYDVYSQEERIKRLCLEYDKLAHYSSTIAEAVNDIQVDVTEQLEEQNKAITEQLEKQNELVNKAIEDMKTYIDQKFAEIAEGMQVYDVTTGTYRPSKQSMRRLAQALSYDHKGDEQLVSNYANNKTVEEMAEQTCYNVAWSDLDSITIDDQLGAVIMLNERSN